MAQKGDPHAWSRAARSGASDSEPEPQLMPCLLRARQDASTKVDDGRFRRQAGFCPIDPNGKVR